MLSHKKFYLLLLGLVIVLGTALTLQHYSGSSAWIWQVSQHGKLLFPLITVAALVDSINPCAFSVLLVSILFLFGLGKTRERILAYGLLYIAGIFVAYFLIGLGILQALHIFSVPHFMSKLAAAILVLFGIGEILEVLFPRFPFKFAIPRSAHTKMNEMLQRVSMPAMFFLGALVGICEFPCTGGPYLTVIGLLHDAQTYWQGARYLVYYNLVFILPLVLILFTASSKVMVEKVQAVQRSENRYIKLGIGFAMILLAYIILII
jgi:cytochrome c-type biogenesis protein